jgi:Na+/H+ antiporter NhaD/arsenite permease-like protein
MFKNKKLLALLSAVLMSLVPAVSFAATGTTESHSIDLTATWFGIASVLVFVVAYVFVITEEFLHLRKSKPVIVAAGIIWLLIGIAFTLEGQSEAASAAIRHNLLEYAELLLFLLAAMTFINTMQERQIFQALRARLVSSGMSFRAIFWVTGILTFFISPIADNLTTALLMAAVVMAIGIGHERFVALACINIVVAANAGGAFSPFGDITTLMVWQRGVVDFEQFLHLFIPSVINWLVPAALMVLAVPKDKPAPVNERVQVKKGGYSVVALFLFTITMTVMLHNYLHLPPFLGMMTGLGLLKILGFFIRRHEIRNFSFDTDPEIVELMNREQIKPARRPFDIFISMKRAEWDTLMFFYGVVLCVGGLGTIGYLAHLSQFFYVDLGPTWANVFVGFASAIVDNIPVMFAVLSMNPDMSLGQWLLVTLTAGVGGSLLSIGSAAGVALMGQARSVYTFFAHLKWTWAIGAGYAISIWVHFLINSKIM